MSFIKTKIISKYLLASLFVGIVLGAIGAFAAQGFRTGIVLVSDFLEGRLNQEPNFLFFLITLSMALVFVHGAKLLIGGKPFKV